MSLFIDSNGLGQIKQIFSQSRFAAGGNHLMTKVEIKGKFLSNPANLEDYMKAKSEDLKDSCSTSVGKLYTTLAFKDALTKNEFDILTIMDSSHKILAFVIAQLGECRINPTFWAVNLICAKSLPGAGSFLLNSLSYAAKQFAAKKKLPNQKVILELARNYNNTEGLYSYSRSGFVKDMSLFYKEVHCGINKEQGESLEDYEKRAAKLEENNRCFCQDTLPMSLNLDAFSNEDLMDFMQGRLLGKAAFAQFDDTGFIETIANHPVKTFNEYQKRRVEARLDQCAKHANLALSEERNKRELEVTNPLADFTQVNKAIASHLEETKECLSKYPAYYETVRNTPERPQRGRRADPVLRDAIIQEPLQPRRGRGRPQEEDVKEDPNALAARDLSARRVVGRSRSPLAPVRTTRSSAALSRSRSSASRSRSSVSRSGVLIHPNSFNDLKRYIRHELASPRRRY